MVLTERLRLRLYLRDSGADRSFSDEELDEILSLTSSIEEAAALGWLLKAGATASDATTVTVGQVSETKGQATESYKIAMSMHAYWKRKSGVGVARWLEIQPDSGVIADMLDTVAAMENYWQENDISRLDPIS